VVVEGF